MRYEVEIADNTKNAFIEDKDITWRAKGLLFFMLNTECVDYPEILSTSKDSERTVKKELKELRENGYLEVKNGVFRVYLNPLPEAKRQKAPLDKKHPYTKLQMWLGKKRAATVIAATKKMKIEPDFLDFIFKEDWIVSKLKKIENPAGYIIALSKGEHWRLYQQKKFLES